ncbi:hypothetical protein [Streptomyces sp. NPDC053560]|uniref:hypothetical protein n=1 Tax=Streptomyces sp. NPDC053560 TaxID=3365711 RepID=UPI0037D51150
MMTYPNPPQADQVPNPHPLQVVILIILLCFRAGYEAPELQQVLMALAVVLVAVAAMRVPAAA